jgi:trimeric autotransporter adhesin
MKTLIRSINRSPLRLALLFIPLVLACFGLVQNAQAQLPAPSPDGNYPGGNTAEGQNALQNVNTGVGINNTAVGFNALTSDTTGAFNVAIGSGALQSNIDGFQNMAIGAEALANNITGNFNMAIGFRALFMNTGGRNSAVGAAALRNNAGAFDNTAIGSTAMRENTTGEENVAIGSGALSANTDGDFNAATGAFALQVNTSGERNTATGNSAMFSNTTGDRNVATGNATLGRNTAGDDNTAVGQGALFNTITGSGNTAVGQNAGSGFTGADSNNICIGADTPGVAGQSNTIRIGTNLAYGGMSMFPIGFTIGSGFPGNGIEYLQFLGSSISIASGFPTTNGSSSCFVGGIFNQTPLAGSHFVQVAANGKLTDASLSSRRFKKDIAAMDKASEGILALKPVTFHWKNDNTNEPEFGLVAEEVAEVNLDWITRNPEGEISGVRYETIPILLLNEFLKEHKKVEEQQASIADLKSTVALQQKEMQVLTAQLKEQAAQIQKVSAQLEASKPAPKVVANK